MKKFWHLIFTFAIFHSSVFSQITEINSIEEGFLRIQDSSLQTGKFKLISRETGDIIYLIGVIHIGEKSYYEKIRSLSRDLDVLFYEGVAFPRQKALNSRFSILENISQANKSAGLKEIMKYQGIFARKIRLARQVEELVPEYNWVNADVSYVEFLSILKKYDMPQDRLTNYLSLDSKNMFQDYIEIKDMEETDPIFIKKMKEYKKKIALNLVNSANELCYGDKMAPVREIIITERNKIAMNYIKKRLNSENPQVIGMLYGAAHIPDFLNILQAEYGFIIDSHEWLNAWNL